MKTNIFLKIAGIIAFVLGSTATVSAQMCWKVEGKTLAKPSYIYGTFHVGNSEVYSVFEKYRPMFESCDVMAGEILLDMQAVMAARSKLFLPNGVTLQTLLGEERYKIVKKAVTEKSPMFALLLDKVKPIITATLLAQDAQALPSSITGDSSSGETERVPLDIYLQQEAKRLQKEVTGLETIDEQLVAFESITLQEQAEYLYKQVTEEGNEGKDEFKGMLEMYQKEDLQALMNLVEGSLSDEANKQLLTVRNTTMANRLEVLMKEKSVFAGVGAAHLGGKTGLIEQLAQRGYTVTPVQ